jgi:hypothetical protein
VSNDRAAPRWGFAALLLPLVGLGLRPDAACGPRWSVVASPNQGTATNILQGVAAVGPGDAWAVGYVIPPNGQVKPLMLHWDGAAWTTVRTPDPSPPMDSLYDVDFIAADDGWAVGVTGDEARSAALIMHWDGERWAVVPTPPSSGSAGLVAVAALSASDAWAVGTLSGHFGQRTYVLHWDGAQWAVVPSPNRGSGFNQLEGVAAIAPDDAWAVGMDFGPQTEETLTLHWDGTIWSIVASPNAPDLDNLLLDVDSTATNDVWAVGRTQNLPPPLLSFTLALHWDGSAWTQVDVPNPSTINGLEGVHARTSEDAWVVGYDGVSGPDESLALHWDGSSWQQARTPRLPSFDTLFSVAAGPDGEVWAVGDALKAGRYVTLAEHVCP